jgi:ribosomal-protein-alanine N-acetyltransferase
MESKEITDKETNRLILKIADSSHAELVLDYYIRNKEFLQEWEGLKKDEFYTKEYHEKYLEEINNETSLRFWLFKKEDISKIIGTVSLNNIIRGAFQSCHLGYKLDKDEINNGYMTEALAKIIEIGFNDLKLHRMEANIMPKNKASLRVVEKLGFYNEGLAYKYLYINGKWENHIHMVLINERLKNIVHN